MTRKNTPPNQFILTIWCLVTGFFSGTNVRHNEWMYAVNETHEKRHKNRLTYTNTIPSNSLSFHSICCFFFLFKILPTASLIVLPLVQFFFLFFSAQLQDRTILRHWLTILIDKKRASVFFSNYRVCCNWRISLLIHMENVSFIFFNGFRQ